VTVRRGYVDTEGGQLHYRERPSSGPPIVFLHQTASSSAMWERMMQRFPADHRLIALDTPGFGMSDPPAGIPADGLAYYARRVDQAIEALGLDQPTLVGHHTGAMIAAEYGAAYADKVVGLVLIGCVVIDSEDVREARLGSLDRWEPDARGDFVSTNILERMKLVVTSGDGEQYLIELAATIEAGPSYWWAYHAVFTYDAPTRLPAIAAPTLCVVGADEDRDMVDWTRAAAALIPNASYHEIPGAGGGAVLEAPDAVASVVHDFVTGSALRREELV
jgi:pimeloyl-ACP methyl ester carboxylesterase